MTKLEGAMTEIAGLVNVFCVYIVAHVHFLGVTLKVGFRFRFWWHFCFLYIRFIGKHR